MSVCKFALTYVNKTSLVLQPPLQTLSRQDLGGAGDLEELLQELRTSSVISDIPWLYLNLGVTWSFFFSFNFFIQVSKIM